MNADDRRLLDEILSEYDPDFQAKREIKSICLSQSSSPRGGHASPPLSPSPSSPDDKTTAAPDPKLDKKLQSGAVDFLLPPPNPTRDHVINVNRQSVCTFDVKVPISTKLPEVFVCRISSFPLTKMEQITGYGFNVNINHVQNNADVLEDLNREQGKEDFTVVETEMAVEEELMPPVFHAPRFGRGKVGEGGEEGREEVEPFQVMVDLPLSSEKWASPASKNAAPTTIKVLIDNSKSIFRPRRLLFQYAFCTAKIKETALEAARDARTREIEVRNEKNYKSVKEGAILGGKILGGLVIGGVVSGAGIGALAGGVVVMGGMKAMDLTKKKLGGDEEGDKEEEQEQEVVKDEKREEGQEEKVKGDDIEDKSGEGVAGEKIEELSYLLSEQVKQSAADNKSWEMEKAILQAQIKITSSRVEDLLEENAKEVKAGQAREEELLQSIVELEGMVKKLKREKKVLVSAVRQGEQERVRLDMTLKSEIHEKRLSGGEREEEYIAQLKEKRKGLVDLQNGQGGGGNQEVAGLVKELDEAISVLEDRRR